MSRLWLLWIPDNVLFCVEWMEHAHIYIYLYQESQDWLDHVYIGCYWSFLEMYSYCQNLPKHGFRHIGSAGFDSCKQQPNSIYRCITLLFILIYIYVRIKMMYSNHFHIIHPLPVERSLVFFFVTRLFWARLIIEKNDWPFWNESEYIWELLVSGNAYGFSTGSLDEVELSSITSIRSYFFANPTNINMLKCWNDFHNMHGPKVVAFRHEKKIQHWSLGLPKTWFVLIAPNIAIGRFVEGPTHINQDRGTITATAEFLALFLRSQEWFF